MGRVKLKVLAIDDVLHGFPSGRRYYFKRGTYTEVNNEEDLDHARNNPQRYEVEGIAEKAKGLIGKAREKITPRVDVPVSDFTGARGQTAWKKDTLAKMTRNQQEWAIKNIYPDFTGEVPKFEAGRIQLILELQELMEGDTLSPQDLKRIGNMK